MTQLAPPPRTVRRRVERVLLRLTTVVAFGGGLLLSAIALTTTYSILGRAISRNLPDFVLLEWWRPIRGDFELVEMGTAIAIFSCLPYTQMMRGHVLVGFLTSSLGAHGKAALAVPANLLLSVIVVLITWRMTVATREFMTADFTQTTMLLGIPIWWGYVPATLCMVLFSVVSLFTVWRSLDEALGEGEPTPA